jgi:hypothetical protein
VGGVRRCLTCQTNPPRPEGAGHCEQLQRLLAATGDHWPYSGATKLHNSCTEDASFFKKRAEQIRAFKGLRLKCLFLQSPRWLSRTGLSSLGPNQKGS